jgi:DegV family protein with EDD domain
MIEPRKRGRPKNKIPRKPTRKLYKIDQVMRLLGLTGRTIRYYDQLGLLPHVKRSDGGIRLFDEQDIELIKRIRRMQQEGQLSLTQIRDMLFTGEEQPVSQGKWVVLTDSTASLPEDTQSLPIDIIPLRLKVNKSTFEDASVSATKLWEKTHHLSIRPATFAPSEADFIEKYKQLANRGYTKVYSVHLSSSFSETYANALAASHKVSEIEVVVLDSRSTGAGLGLLVKLIAERITKGTTPSELDLLIEKQLPLVYNLLTLNTLKYFLIGGELSENPDTLQNPISLLEKLGTLKPIVSMRNGSGDLEILECSRDKDAAIRTSLDILESEIKSRGGYVREVMLVYNYMYGEAVMLATELKKRYHNAVISLVEGGAVLSAYTGPESLMIGII